MLTVSGLSTHGLSDVAFELAPGECIAVEGASGAGKSLLLRALADLDPHTGRVELDGRSQIDLPAPDWRRRVCYLASEAGWWADRVADHFQDWPELADDLAALELPQDCANWPVTRLSTGEKQRLALLRALEVVPRVLLLDEPTSAVDPAGTLAVESMIEARRAQALAVIWVTHDPAQANRVAKRVFLIADGGMRLR